MNGRESINENMQYIKRTQKKTPEAYIEDEWKNN